MSLDKSKKIFGRNPTRGYVYQWQPQDDKTKLGKDVGKLKGNVGCDATPYSQGDDYITTYTYNVYLVGSVVHKLAYVACDYVK
jgi:hypothetical protein